MSTQCADAGSAVLDDCSAYIHIPFCSRKCRYCAFYSVIADPRTQRRYLNAIRQEWLLYESPSPFSTVFLGGGSPTAIDRGILLELLDWIIPHAARDAEMTIEVNPGQTDASFFDELLRRGINRISIGAQSFSDAELDFLGRIHSACDTVKCFSDARAAGFDNIGLDLMFAVPGSTLRDWQTTLHKAIDLNPAHISAYSLTYEGDTPLVQAMQAGHITPIDEDLDRAMYEMAIDTLENAGLNQYEISNFARPGFECRHNLRYWHNKPYLGFGPAAASCYRGKRTENVSDLESYIKAIQDGQFAYESQQVLAPLDIACETAVLNLRMRPGIHPETFKQRTGFDIMQLFAAPIAEHLAHNHLEWHNEHLRLTRSALSIADKILCDFAAPDTK